MTQLSSALRQARKTAGLTLREAAQRLGVATRSVARWEEGTRVPSLATLAHIAKAYGVSLPSLMEQCECGSM